VGYATLGRGIAIHRSDCSNIEKLSEDKRDRLLKVSWGFEPDVFKATLCITAQDRKGLLKDIYQVLTQGHVNILSTQSQTDPSSRMVDMKIEIEVDNLAQVTSAVTRISEVHNVSEVKRTD
jgi:GTP pyrophosphokinase